MDQPQPEEGSVDPALVAQAQREEEKNYAIARLRYLEDRVLSLNVEVRLRDEKIAKLEEELKKRLPPKPKKKA